MPDSNIGLAPKIILNYNGGRDRETGLETKEFYVAYDTEVTCPAPVHRDNYDYQGWARNSRANSPTKPYKFNATDSEYKLFCIWSHYDITLNYNGGESESGETVNSHTFMHTIRGTQIPIGEQSTVMPAARSGFQFLGWGEGRSVPSEDLYTDTYTVFYDKTLYANWKELTYTVTCVMNGGKYDGSTGNVTLTKYGGSVLELPQPTRTGYDFLGWASENTPAGSVAFEPGQKYTWNAAHTLTAVWQLKTYTVRYMLNGGSGSFGNQTKTYGVPLTLHSASPTRTGYVFLGWASDASGTVAYQPGSTYTGNANLTLTAVWEPTYDIKYNVNGGSGAFPQQTKNHNVEIKLHSEKPTRKGYQFMGWAGDDYPTVAYAAGATYSVNKSITLTAVWKRVAVPLVDVSEATIGYNPVFNWTPDISTDYFSIRLTFKSWSYTITPIRPGTASTYTYSGYTLPMELCTLLGDATSGRMTAVLTTYDQNGTEAGTSSKEFTINVPGGEMPDFDYELSDLNPTGLGIYVTNRSIIQAKLTLHPADGTTITTARLIIDGEAATANVSGSTVILTTGKTILEEAVKTVTMEVTDSRGRSVTKSTTVNVWGYQQPTIAIALEEDEENDAVIITLKGFVSPLNGNNEAAVTLVRTGKIGGEFILGEAVVGTSKLGGWDEDEETELDITQPVTTTFTITHTDDLSGADYSTVRYTATVTDIWGNTATVTADLWLGERLFELTEDEILIGFDTDITSDTHPLVTVEDGVLTIDASTCELNEEVLVGYPFLLQKEHRYQLSYDTNMLANTVVKVSYFAQDGQLTLIDTDTLDTGSVITAPTHAYDNKEDVWAVIFFGMDYVDETDTVRKFWDVSLKELFPTSIEDIPWFMETCQLGLDTPNHKYISKIQLRVAFDGVASVSISYEGGDFMRVFSGKHEELRSFTIPINVRRCDHFRLRMEGVGQLKLFSMGYSTAEGSQWGA